MDKYPKYHVKTMSPVEEAYFDSIKKLTTETKKKKKKQNTINSIMAIQFELYKSPNPKEVV